MSTIRYCDKCKKEISLNGSYPVSYKQIYTRPVALIKYSTERIDTERFD